MLLFFFIFLFLRGGDREKEREAELIGGRIESVSIIFQNFKSGCVVISLRQNGHAYGED